MLLKQTKQQSPEELGALIEAWYADCIHNSVVSRDTTVVNHVRASVDELKSRLGIGKSASPSAAATDQE